MRVNIGRIAQVVVLELLTLHELEPGQSQTLPAIEVKSGKTAVKIEVTVTEDEE